MTWSKDECETILAAMRAGATVTTGGSRCNTTYFFSRPLSAQSPGPSHADFFSRPLSAQSPDEVAEEGEWGYEAFDEGATERYATSEDSIRALIERDPELFRPVLRAGPWRRFSAAFVARPQTRDAREQAREFLRAALVYGDPQGHGRILDAVLAWPERAPDAEILESIRADLSGFTAWHVFMDAVCWDRSPASGRLGLEYCDTLAAMLGAPDSGDAIGWHYLRASFHELQADLDAALLELDRELDTLPPDHHNRGHIERMRERVSKLRASG